MRFSYCNRDLWIIWVIWILSSGVSGLGIGGKLYWSLLLMTCNGTWRMLICPFWYLQDLSVMVSTIDHGIFLEYLQKWEIWSIVLHWYIPWMYGWALVHFSMRCPIAWLPLPFGLASTWNSGRTGIVWEASPGVWRLWRITAVDNSWIPASQSYYCWYHRCSIYSFGWGSTSEEADE